MAQLAAVLPACGLQCLEKGIMESDCGLTNQTCICTDPTLNANVELCVATSCTIRESLKTKNITLSACDAPVIDRSKIISYAGVIGGVIAFIVFLGRMIARLPCFGGQLGWDDLTIALATCLNIPFMALSVVLANAGLGKDIWHVEPSNITRILYIYFFDESIYLSILPLTKISILFFYLLIFPKRSFRIACYVVMSLNVAYLIAFVLVSVFQCRPLKGAWTRWDGEEDIKCNNINAQGWASAVTNMILDLIVMALPLRELSQLSLSIRKKLFVMSMFSLGIFVTLVSILRLKSLIQFAQTKNLTWDYVPIGYWSTIEADVGIICACLPALRSLFRHVFPSVFGGITHDNTYSKGSVVSRSQGANSRLEGPKSNKRKDQDTEDFVPLVDIERQHP